MRYGRFYSTRLSGRKAEVAGDKIGRQSLSRAGASRCRRRLPRRFELSFPFSSSRDQASSGDEGVKRESLWTSAVVVQAAGRCHNSGVRPALKALSITLICASLALLVFAQRATAQSDPPDEPEANPSRPTVSTPATLTPVGYLQFETGALGASDSPEFSTRVGFNEVMKLSVAPRLELIAAAEPIVHYTSDGITANSAAEVFLGAQVVLAHGEGATPTVAVSYFHRAYDGGAPEVDFGSPVNSGLVLASADVWGFHYDANAMLNELTQGSVRRAQFGQSLSVSHPLVGKFSVSGEIWHFTQPFFRGNAVGNLWAVGYAARRTVVFDAGFDRGLTSTSTQWEAFAGFTYLLPRRLWGR